MQGAVAKLPSAASRHMIQGMEAPEAVDTVPDRGLCRTFRRGIGHDGPALVTQGFGGMFGRMGIRTGHQYLRSFLYAGFGGREADAGSSADDHDALTI